MPTVLRIGGWRFVIYPNDHPPSHVHVIGPGWSVVINVAGAAQVREVVGKCAARDVQKALALAEAHRETLLEAWKQIHG